MSTKKAKKTEVTEAEIKEEPTQEIITTEHSSELKVKDEKILDDVSAVTAAQSVTRLDVTGLDEWDVEIFTAFIELLKSTPYHFEAIAAARLSMMANVTQLVKDNVQLASSIAQLCEHFEVSINTTIINDLQVHTGKIAIKRDGRYDTKTLQMALAALIARFNSIVTEKRALEQLLSQAESVKQRLTEEAQRYQTENTKLRSIPPPPTIGKPFVLMRRFTKKDKKGNPVDNYVYVAEDEKLQYISSGLVNAKRFVQPEEAAELLAFLCDKYAEFPIRKIHEYQIVSLHYLEFFPSKLSNETQLKLSKSLQRATLNDKK